MANCEANLYFAALLAVLMVPSSLIKMFLCSDSNGKLDNEVFYLLQLRVFTIT